MRFERGRGGRDERRGGVEAEVDVLNVGIVGGDQVILVLRVLCADCKGILRMISKVVRHRICKRAPNRHAVCDAVGDGTERDVANAR